MQTWDTAKEAQSEADRLNIMLIPQQRIAKVYLKFPEKRWGIDIQPFEYIISEATLKEMYSLTPEERKLTKILPVRMILMAKHKATIEQRDMNLPYQGSMADITKLAAALGRREREIPYINPEGGLTRIDSRTPESIKEGLAEGGLLRLTDYDKRTQEEWFGKHTPYYTPIPASGRATIYRATVGKSFRIGDYVTQSKDYAKLHLKSVLRGEGKIISKVVGLDELSPVNPSEFYLLPPKAKNNPHKNQYESGAQCKFIHAMTYQCVPGANIGLCAHPHPESELWRHEWKDNRNRVCSVDDRRFLFKKGEIVEVGKAIVNNTGINDWHKDTVFENTQVPKNAKATRLIGELVSIEFTDGSKIDPSGYNLMSDNTGRKLFLQPKKNPIFMVKGWSESQGEYGQPVFADTPVQAAAKVKKVHPDREIHSVHKIAENGGGKKTLLFFYMKECTHCQSMKKWIDDLPVKVVKVDCHEKPDLAGRHGIEYTPTLVLLTEKSSKKRTGEMTKAEVLKFIG